MQACSSTEHAYDVAADAHGEVGTDGLHMFICLVPRIHTLMGGW